MLDLPISLSLYTSCLTINPLGISVDMYTDLTPITFDHDGCLFAQGTYLTSTLIVEINIEF
jgi:hypothetical protein